MKMSKQTEFVNQIINSLINYFDKKQDFIIDIDRSYLNYKEIDRELLNNTFDLLDKMGTDLHSCSFEDFLKNSKTYIRNYLKFLIDKIEFDLIENDILDPVEKYYLDEYKTIFEKIKNKKIEKWQEVNKSLLYWKDSISDELLQNSLLFLKFIYLFNMASEKLNLEFPDKLNQEIYRMQKHLNL
jgi:hypothetical protein